MPPDFEFYTHDYMGISISETNFPRLITWAARELTYFKKVFTVTVLLFLINEVKRD